jgi:hypothetical protein
MQTQIYLIQMQEHLFAMHLAKLSFIDENHTLGKNHFS